MNRASLLLQSILLVGAAGVLGFELWGPVGAVMVPVLLLVAAGGLGLLIVYAAVTVVSDSRPPERPTAEEEG